MAILIKKPKLLLLRRIISYLILLAFLLNSILPTPLFAQTASMPITSPLPLPASMVNLTPSFVPAIFRGIKIHPENPFNLDFILDTGHSKLEGDELKKESDKLIKYFLASLTTPQEDIWVNLSPYEKERIIPEKFGQTEMGRDLLSQDYLLKQLTASLITPENDLGKKFWDKLYKEAYERYGTTDIPVDTFNKVWIVPDHATVYEKNETAFITESRLRVMLEEDYEALRASSRNAESRAQTEGGRGIALRKSLVAEEKYSAPRDALNSLVVNQMVKEIVLPAIELEVNEGENFATLRQIFHSLILASWFKRSLRESLLGQKYADQNKVKGIDLEDKDIAEKIYNQYLEAFQKGVYNFIKEEYDPQSQEIIERKYFSGGFMSGDMASLTSSMLTVKKLEDPANPAILQVFEKLFSKAVLVNATLGQPPLRSITDSSSSQASSDSVRHTGETSTPAGDRAMLSKTREEKLQGWGLITGRLSKNEQKFADKLYEQLKSHFSQEVALALATSLVKAKEETLDYLVQERFLKEQERGVLIRLQGDIDLAHYINRVKQDMNLYDEDKNLRESQKRKLKRLLFTRFFTFGRYKTFRINLPVNLTILAGGSNPHPLWWERTAQPAITQLEDELGESLAKQWVVGHPKDPYKSWIKLLEQLGKDYQKLKDELGESLAKQWVVNHPKDPYNSWVKLLERLGDDYQKLKDELGEYLAKQWVVGHSKDPYNSWVKLLKQLGDDYQKLEDELGEGLAKQWVVHHPKDPYQSWVKFGRGWVEWIQTIGISEFDAKRAVVSHAVNAFIVEAWVKVLTNLAEEEINLNLAFREMTGGSLETFKGFLTSRLPHRSLDEIDRIVEPLYKLRYEGVETLVEEIETVEDIPTDRASLTDNLVESLDGNFTPQGVPILIVAGKYDEQLASYEQLIKDLQVNYGQAIQIVLVQTYWDAVRAIEIASKETKEGKGLLKAVITDGVYHKGEPPQGQKQINRKSGAAMLEHVQKNFASIPVFMISDQTKDMVFTDDAGNELDYHLENFIPTQSLTFTSLTQILLPLFAQKKTPVAANIGLDLNNLPNRLKLDLSPILLELKERIHFRPWRMMIELARETNFSRDIEVLVSRGGDEWVNVSRGEILGLMKLGDIVAGGTILIELKIKYNRPSAKVDLLKTAAAITGLFKDSFYEILPNPAQGLYGLFTKINSATLQELKETVEGYVKKDSASMGEGEDKLRKQHPSVNLDNIRRLRQLARQIEKLSLEEDEDELPELIEQAQEILSRINMPPVNSKEFELYIETLVNILLSVPFGYDAYTGLDMMSSEQVVDRVPHIIFGIIEGGIEGEKIHREQKVQKIMKRTLQKHIRPLNKPHTTKRLENGFPIVIKPLTTLAEFFQLQQNMGDEEIGIISIPDPKNSIMLIYKGRDSAVNNHLTKSLRYLPEFYDGHTHVFSMPVEPSEDDTETAEGVAEFGKTSFVISFDAIDGHLELAYFTPENRNWRYEHSDQEKIAELLKKFGVLQRTIDLVRPADETSTPKGDRASMGENQPPHFKEPVYINDSSPTKTVGGIDLTPTNLNLQIRRDKEGNVVPLTPQQIQNIQIDGLMPVIINLTPINNLPLFLGGSEYVPQETLSMN